MTDHPKFAPKCIWCNAEWSDKNIRAEAECAEVYESVGPEITSLSVSIACHACNREMYRKECL